MDDGLIQILVIAFFVIISMMDGAARKKRKQNERLSKGGGLEGVEEPGELFPGEPEPTSQGLLSADLWQEIAALASGDSPPSARRLPPSPTPDVERASIPIDAYESEETRLNPVHQHVEAHDHVEWEPEDEPALGMMPARDEGDVGESLTFSAPSLPIASHPQVPTSPPRRSSTEWGEDRPATDLGEKPGRTHRSPQRMEAVLRTLTKGRLEGLRQAVILSEILGQPAALRGSVHEPPR